MANPPTTPVSSQLFGDLNFHDYLAIAKRRLFWIVLPAIGVLIATAIVAWRLPDVYRC